MFASSLDPTLFQTTDPDPTETPGFTTLDLMALRNMMTLLMYWKPLRQWRPGLQSRVGFTRIRNRPSNKSRSGSDHISKTESGSDLISNLATLLEAVIYSYHYIREAAKKVLFLVAWPLRKKNFFCGFPKRSFLWRHSSWIYRRKNLKNYRSISYI